MEKTSWLRKLFVEALEDPFSAPAKAMKQVMDVFSVHNCFLYYREVLPRDTHLIYYCDGNARIVETDESFRPMYALLQNVVYDGKPRAGTGNILVPLQSMEDGIPCFGALVLPGGTGSWNVLSRGAVEKLSTVLMELVMSNLKHNLPPVEMQVKSITVKYGTGDTAGYAVDHLSCSIRAGELTVIMGPSGCGKSTLLNVMGGLLTPQEGRVLWGKKDVCAMSRRQKDTYHRDTLGFIFQNYNLMGHLTAEENVSVSAVLSPGSRKPKDVLAQMGLAGMEKKYPRQMSGGEQQRVCIARALVKNAKILLCDEPTGALDTEHAKNIMALLQNVAIQQNIPVVVVTHNPDFARLADHCIIMSNGKIAREIFQPFPYNAERIL